MKCKYCGRELKPAPAKHDGEPTYVGFLPCDPEECFNLSNERWEIENHNGRR